MKRKAGILSELILSDGCAEKAAFAFGDQN